MRLSWVCRVVIERLSFIERLSCVIVNVCYRLVYSGFILVLLMGWVVEGFLGFLGGSKVWTSEKN